MVGTSQEQLDKASQSVPGFLGAFAADELPTLPKKPFSLIVNYSRSDSPTGGTHWVAMKFPMRGDAMYFDSYGKPPDNFDDLLHTATGFAAYMRKHSATGEYIYSNLDLQCYGPSDVCGEWSTAFIHIGELPSVSTNNPEWLKIMQGTAGAGIGDGEQDRVGSACSARDSAVFKMVGIRKDRARGFPL